MPRFRLTVRRMMLTVAIVAPFFLLLRRSPVMPVQAQALQFAKSRPTSSYFEATALYCIATHAETAQPGILAKRPTVVVNAVPGKGYPVVQAWSFRLIDQKTGKVLQAGTMHFGLDAANVFRDMVEPRDGAGGLPYSEAEALQRSEARGLASSKRKQERRISEIRSKRDRK